MTSIDDVLERLVNDPTFRDQLTTDREAALAGYELSDDDLDVLESTVSAEVGMAGSMEGRQSKSALLGAIGVIAESGQTMAGSQGTATEQVPSGASDDQPTGQEFVVTPPPIEFVLSETPSEASDDGPAGQEFVVTAPPIEFVPPETPAEPTEAEEPTHLQISDQVLPISGPELHLQVEDSEPIQTVVSDGSTSDQASGEAPRVTVTPTVVNLSEIDNPDEYVAEHGGQLDEGGDESDGSDLPVKTDPDYKYDTGLIPSPAEDIAQSAGEKTAEVFEDAIDDIF